MYHDDELRRVVGLNFGLSLPLIPYFVYVISEGPVEIAHMHRFV